MEERTAIARLKQGDPGGLEFLVRTYQVRALRAVYLITGDAEQARDIVQTAFLRAYERIHQFDPSKGFGPWFLRSVVNDALKAATRKRRHLSLDTDYADAPIIEALAEIARDPEQQAELGELHEAVMTALDQLTPEHRAIIVLRYYFEWTDTEIAKEFARPRGTIRRWLHEAREHLRELLQPWHPFGTRLRE